MDIINLDLLYAILRFATKGAPIGTLLSLRSVSSGFRQACCKLLEEVEEVRTPLIEGRGRFFCSPTYYKAIFSACPQLKALIHTSGGDYRLEDFLHIVCSYGQHPLMVLEAWFLPCIETPPLQLPTLSHLKVLCLRHCSFQASAEMVFSSSTFPALRYLDASWCHSLRKWHFNVWPQLETLMLRGCDGLDDNLIPNLVMCKTLDCGSTGITDQGLLTLAEVAPRLEQLYLSAVRSNLWAEGSLTEGGLSRLRALRPDLEFHFTDVPADLPSWRTLAW